MIKRTPQEIADFFQGYIAQDRDGKWYIYFEKPVLGPDLWISAGGMAISLNRFIKEEFEHDWTILYEPRNITPESGNINSKSGENCQKSDLCPHQSAVHTHQEYQVIADPDASNLFSRVNRLLADGWRPQGGIAVEHIDGENDSGYILYQAMVRGLQQ